MSCLALVGQGAEGRRGADSSPLARRPDLPDDKAAIKSEELAALDAALGGAIADVVALHEFKGKAVSGSWVGAWPTALDTLCLLLHVGGIFRPHIAPRVSGSPCWGQHRAGRVPPLSCPCCRAAARRCAPAGRAPSL